MINNTIKAGYILSFFIFLILASCGDKEDDSPTYGNQAANQNDEEDLSDLKIFRSGDANESNLLRCSKARYLSESCTPDELPLLGQVYDDSELTPENIARRVLVSHDWMGERMTEFLQEMPEDLLKMFRSVTTIIIDDDIRPAYYWTLTGSIYLDPAYLWITFEEYETINKKEDFRSGFGSELSYSTIWRYVKGDENAFNLYKTGQKNRNRDGVFLLLTRLLYHELAHANDFFPKESFDDLDGSEIINKNALNIESKRLSNKLVSDMPLNSPQLDEHAYINYISGEADDAQKAITGEELGEKFAPEGAVHLYSFTTRFEDYAMLVEATMMKFHYDIDLQFAFISKPEEDDKSCEDWNILWGSKNRLNATAVKSRAQFVSEGLYPEWDAEGFFSSLEAEETFSTGESWCLPTANQDAAKFMINTEKYHSHKTLDLAAEFLGPGLH